MRTIKFRAWHPTTKEMMPVETIDWDETGYLTEVSAGYTWAEKFDPGKFQQLVLMQFTGLIDKNGKEIYEGDVVQYGDFVGRIEYEGYRFWFWNENGRCSDTLHGGDQLEVIGNRYENPELLEV